MQLAAAAAYRNDAQWHEEANIHVYAERRALAEEIMRTLGCTFDPTQVGMFLWGRIPESCDNVEQLTEKILHEARVFITPGNHDFCAPGSLWLEERWDSSSAVTVTGISGFRFAPKKRK